METLENNPIPPSPWSGLGTRIASSVVLGALFLAVLWYGGGLFIWLVCMAALLMMREWSGLTDHDESLWRLAGMVYVSIPCASLIWLRSLETLEIPKLGLHCILFVAITVWATDIGAYFTGRQFGRTKLAPAISPNKTWEGLGGGIFAAIIAAQISELAFPVGFSLGKAFVLGVIIAIVAQGGDLFESWMKRRAGVKDSGTLIPGHGGLLDRVDGLMFTLPLFALVACLS